ncbi:MAG: hypothetical protein WCT11_04540 [Candidatus Magasanikbacteria bacterium]|jgi:hypothetical protein
MDTKFDSGAARSIGGMGFHTLPHIVEVNAEMKQRWQDIGRLGQSVLTKVSGLVAMAMAGELGLEWISKLMLGSIPGQYHNLARELMITVGERSPVRFFRADVVGEGQIAEFQCPGSGWAYSRELEQHYGISAEESPILAAYKDWANGRKLSWWLHDQNHRNSVRFLCEECRKIGVEVIVAENDNDFDAESAEAVIKRPPLPELIAHPKGRRLLERWLKGEVELDLLPTMVPETKFVMALLHHPTTGHLFTTEEKGLCPPTFVVYEGGQEIPFKGKNFTVRELVERHPRNFVLKYGGACKEFRGGCHAVYHLGVKSMKLVDRTELLGRAVVDAQVGEGWILQEFRPAHWNIKDIFGRNNNFYAIFRPHYYLNEVTGLVEMVNSSVAARHDWKVHCRSDAYLGICQ